MDCASTLSAWATQGESEAQVCDGSWSSMTLAYLRDEVYVPPQWQSYDPPEGVDAATTYVVDLCRATCQAVGAGPCKDTPTPPPPPPSPPPPSPPTTSEAPSPPPPSPPTTSRAWVAR
eukprot:gene8087-7700_t